VHSVDAIRVMARQSFEGGDRAVDSEPDCVGEVRPTCPEELASPAENRWDFEFSSSLADSQALAATTTARHLMCCSVRVALST